MSEYPCWTLPGLPTELLIRIFAHLQIADLLSIQHSCHRFYDVISESAFLQYILHAEINHLEPILPLDVPLNDRVALLKHHETAWKNLELNALIQFVASEEIRAHCYILQDGYLVYKAVILAAITQTPRYGYLDLYSISDQPNAELRWTQISLAAISPLSDIIFAVDQDLAVAIRNGENGPELSFLQFTTGARHPLSSTNTVSLPEKPELEVFGDYILVTAEDESRGSSVFSVVSWKTGIYTQLYNRSGVLRALVIDPGDSLIALLESATNCIHICKLQFLSATPRLRTVCFLRLPGTSHRNPPSVFMSSTEWIPTSKPQDRTESQASRRRPFPFRSYRASTIGMILRFAHQYAMFVSVDALLSVVRPRAGHILWDDWGPASTRILPLGTNILPRPAGPFWITNYEPLVVRDYNSLRARYIKPKEPSTTSPYPPLGPPTTKMFGKHWAGGSIKTHLPFREFAAGDLFFKRVAQVVADREWVVVISRTGREQGTRITVYHVG